MRRQIFSWKRPVSPAKAKARALAADFGRNVRARRMAAGLRQTDLARVCRVGAAHICEVERGQTNPSLETMALIAEGLGCDLGALMATPGAIVLKPDEARKAQDALVALKSVLAVTPSEQTGEHLAQDDEI